MVPFYQKENILDNEDLQFIYNLLAAALQKVFV